MTKLDPDLLSYLHDRASRLKHGVYCEVNYTTSSGKPRTVRGLFDSINDDFVVLLQNNRRNRVPVDQIIWWTYNIKQNGGEL